MHISDQKDELRVSVVERLKQMSDKEREAESRSVCRRLLPLIAEGSTVCVYAAMKTEVDLTTLIDELLARGDAVFMPCTDGEHMTFRQLKDLKELRKGTLSFLEPPADAPELDPADASLVIAPGRAFDRSGNRLGRGNAGYDIWIRAHRNKNPDTKYIGASFECQMFNQIPTEEHDEKMDKVITAVEVIECRMKNIE